MWRTPPYEGPERRRSRRWRPRPIRVLLVLLVLVVVGYAAAVLWLVSQEARIVFQAGRTLSAGQPVFPYEQIDLPRRDGARQFAWVMRQKDSDDGTWALYLHGNAATIASNVNISHYRLLRRVGLNLFAPEYRGFGGLEGTPTEGVLGADARAAYDYLRVTRGIPPSRIVIYGWSLGSAVAVRLASEVDEAAVILEGAPASLVDIGRQRYPFFPIRLLMRNPFESIRIIDRIHAPILFLHSPEDAVIPISEGRRLFDAARVEKEFVEVRGGHLQASEIDAERFYTAIRPFLIKHGLLAQN
ncbi:MAG: alpha/beta fold hydrolase [Acidobacteriota bacterium]